jgi:hypothetical protein
MFRRLFPADKNHILMEVQSSRRNALLQELVDVAKKYYLDHHNPLGLIDDTILEIQSSKDFSFDAFNEFYHDMATIYRFKHGEVQLEFLFDGTTHDEKYANEWADYFTQNIRAFCSNKLFLRAVLDIAVFHHHDHVAQLAGVRLKYFLSAYFDLKVYKYRGIMEIAS